MSQFFKNRPVLKVFAALGACCVPLYMASASIGPSYGKLIDLKLKEEREQLQKENSYDPNHWRIKLLDAWKHSFKSPIPFDLKMEDRFLEKIAHAEGDTPEGFEADFKQPGESSKDVHDEAIEAADTPDKETEKESAPVSESGADEASGESEGSKSAESAEPPAKSAESPESPEVNEDTKKPTGQQKIHNSSEEEDKVGRNPVAANLTNGEVAPAKHVEREGSELEM